MIVLFESVKSAVTASIRAQPRMTAEQWTTQHPLTVPMGLHAAEAENRDNDFYGPTLSRTSRIMAAAHTRLHSEQSPLPNHRVLRT